MLNKLLDWLFPENDWTIVEVMHGNWTIVDTYTGKKQYVPEVCVFEIYYSPSKKDYKLVLSGRTPKEHDQYIEAVKRLNELKNESKTPKETP